MIQNYQLTKDRFVQFLQDELRSLEQFVSENILLGISLDAIGVSCDLNESMDNGDRETPGYGAFYALDEVALDNEDSDKFERALKQLGDRSFVQLKDGRVHYDAVKSALWLANVDGAKERSYALMHATAGLAGRGTEEALIQHTNEEFGAARNVEVSKGTIQLNMAYHKGAIETGLFKLILRIMPYRLARIFFILLRVVRPVELGAFLRLFIKGANKEKRREVTHLYRTRVFVSWGKAWDGDRLSGILKKWFKDGLGVPMGLRMYRHMVTAFARRYIKYSVVDGTEDLQAAADAQAGRSQKTSYTHYSIEKRTKDPMK